MDQVPETPVAVAPEVAPEQVVGADGEEMRNVDAQVREILTATSPGK